MIGIREKALASLQESGYCVFPEYYTVEEHLCGEVDLLMQDYQYKGGRSHKTTPHSLSRGLLDIVCSIEIGEVFNTLCDSIICQDIFMTHDFKNDEMERNMWLHIDRLRCYKAMVYLTDVDESCGPFSVVPKSHKNGYFIRNSFKHMSYANKPNRIKLDHPHLYEEPLKICGKKGTLILFDTDIFHMGGKVDDEKERMLIRSHWFPQYDWRVNS